MLRAFRTVRPATVALFVAGCGLLGTDQLVVTYDVDPQEFVQDFGTQSGTVPSVDCSASAAVCSTVPAPAGTTASCDPTLKKCVLTADVRLSQTVNLSKQASFPSQITNSSLINDVSVNKVSYWTATNTLTFDTPPTDIYIGPQTLQSETDPNATKLGTLPSLPAGKPTQCGNGAPATKDSACMLPLTAAGQAALGTLAKDYKTPFNVLVVAHVKILPGQPMPGGKLDLWVQPELAFTIPIK